MTRKAHNLDENISKIYFSINDENFQYSRVQRRAATIISANIDWNISIVEKLSMKYMGTTCRPLSQMIMENKKKEFRL